MTNERRHLMAERKYHLLYIPSNQSVGNYYEGVIQSFLSASKGDDLFAWKDYRVGGLRANMNGYIECAQEFLPDNFSEFKKKRRKELEDEIAQAKSAEDTQRLHTLEQEYNALILPSTQSYTDFAREMKERVESEMQYPGTVKIIVIRESRAQEEAK